MQICVSRMAKESGIFIGVCSHLFLSSNTEILQLLSVLAVGFAQGLYALDAADGSTEPPSSVTRVCSLHVATSQLLVSDCQCARSSNITVRISCLGPRHTV